MKKRIILIVIAAIGIGAGVLFFRNEKQNTHGALQLNGNIDIRTVDLGFNEQERIAEILVEEGQPVTANQPLARQATNRIAAQIEQTKAQIAAQAAVVSRLETGSRPEEIAQARAEVDAAKARVQNAELSFKRLKTTSQAGVTSVQIMDDARAQLDVALAQQKVAQKALALVLAGPRQEDILAARSTRQSLEASLNLLSVRLAEMTLYAPSDGVIQKRIQEPGAITNPARPVLTLALTDPKWARVFVSEPDLGRVRLGLSASITSDAFPEQMFDGWVGYISPMAEFTPKNVETEDLRTNLVYELRVFVRDPQGQLPLGMPVTVTVGSTMSPHVPKAMLSKSPASPGPSDGSRQP